MPRKQSIVSEVPPAPQLQDLLTIEDVQERLKVGRRRILWLIEHEDLPVIRWGYRTLRFHPEALARWLAEQAL